MKHLIFVYGSLKQGMSNHCILSQQRYIGTAITEENYNLYDLGHFPAVVDKSHPDFKLGYSIYGELYEVDDQCLQILDEFEGVDCLMYRRQQIKIQKINLVNLPTTSETYVQFLGNSPESYFYCKSVKNSCQLNFWTENHLHVRNLK